MDYSRWQGPDRPVSSGSSVAHSRLQSDPDAPTAARAPERAPESIPLTNERRERTVQAISVGAPLLALASAVWLAWGDTLHWYDLVVFAVMYLLTGLGITLGYHRLFTHRSFKTTRGVRAALAVLGSMAVQGSVVEWTATHSKHHAYSDQPGDPHSPHVDAEAGWRGALRGLAHAHL